MNRGKKIVIWAISFQLLLAGTSASGAPIKKDRNYYEKRGDIIWDVRTDLKIMALTFDDGPDVEQTPEILELLHKYEAKCTFFVVGKRVLSYPELTRRIVSEGHELANHTFSHVYFTPSTSIEVMQRQLKQTEDAIVSVTNRTSTFFRPPGGMYSEKMIKATNEAGLKTIMWSWHQDTRDWATPGVRKIANKVLNNARNGDIVLFHDHVYPHSQTKEALEIILPELKQRGYRFVTVTELLKASSQPVKK